MLSGNFNLISDLLNGSKPCVKVIFEDNASDGGESYILGFLQQDISYSLTQILDNKQYFRITTKPINKYLQGFEIEVDLAEEVLKE